MIKMNLIKPSKVDYNLGVQKLVREVKEAMKETGAWPEEIPPLPKRVPLPLKKRFINWLKGDGFYKY